MRTSYTTICCILVTVIMLTGTAFYSFHEPSSGEALPSTKLLIPSYPYTRKKSISHVNFSPQTFEQSRDPTFNFQKQFEDLVENKVDMYDNEMIMMIRNYLIDQPSMKSYNLENEDLFDYSGGQSATVDNVMKFKEGGFYVECCNTDGEINSSTLFFERVRKWNGLVIIDEPDKFRNLQQKNRKALAMNGCLSHSNLAEKRMSFSNNSKNDVHCFPFYSIMAAMEKSSIDLFCLDVGGKDELSILQNIPFNYMTISMISVRFEGEMRHFKSEVQLYLENHGYDTVLKLVKDDYSVHHLILKRKSSFLRFDIFRILLTFILITIVCGFVYMYVSKHYQKKQRMFP